MPSGHLSLKTGFLRELSVYPEITDTVLSPFLPCAMPAGRLRPDAWFRVRSVSCGSDRPSRYSVEIASF